MVRHNLKTWFETFMEERNKIAEEKRKAKEKAEKEAKLREMEEVKEKKEMHR